MNEEDNIESSFEEFEVAKERRRKLLPWWIKVFCWIFMFTGVMGFVCLILGLFGFKPTLAMYGFETNELFSLIGATVVFIFLLKGVAAFFLWFEKDLAIKIGRIDAIVGIILCCIAMFILPFFQDGFNITLRLELALLIPYLIKLNKIQKKWEA